MRDIDIKVTRTIHILEMDGQRIEVPDPSIKQLGTHEQHRGAYLEMLKEAREEGNASKEMELQYEFMVKQIELLAPEIPKEIVENMTVDMYDDIMIMLGVYQKEEKESGEGEKGEGEKGEGEKGKTKKKRGA